MMHGQKNITTYRLTWEEYQSCLFVQYTCTVFHGHISDQYFDWLNVSDDYGRWYCCVCDPFLATLNRLAPLYVYYLNPKEMHERW
jgi:hypothetical protein